jgi:hypothetical protein
MPSSRARFEEATGTSCETQAARISALRFRTTDAIEALLVMP